MDKNHIITMTTQQEDLDLDMERWRGLTYHLIQESDIKCRQFYKMGVEELYEAVRSNTDLFPDDTSLIESAILEAIDFELTGDDREEKFVRSSELRQDPNVVIINPFFSDAVPDYSIEDLEATYQRYLALPDSLKDQSDAYSVSLWGKDVHNMYSIMRLKFTTNIDNELQRLDPDFGGQKDRLLNDYNNTVCTEIAESCDIMSLLYRKMDLSYPKSALQESVVCEDMIEQIDQKMDTGYFDYGKEIPLVTPFFTPDEMEDLIGAEVDPYEFSIAPDQKRLHEELRQAYHLFEASPTDKNRDRLIRLGWNPSVPYNEYTMTFARDRTVQWFNDHKSYQIIDMSQIVINEADVKEEPDITDLEPIHIVLLQNDFVRSKVIRWWTKSKFSHAGISFDTSMKNIYSFNAKGPNDKDFGFVVESLDFWMKTAKNPHVEVVTFFVPKEVKKELQKSVMYYVTNKSKTKYDFMNYFRIVFNKTKDTAQSLSMVCSQFVDAILKSVKIDLSGKPSNLTYPGDFDPKPGSRLFVTFFDKIEKYRPQIVANKVRFLLKRPHDSIVTLPVMEVVDQFFLTKDIRYLMSETDSPKVNECLRQIRELLVAESVVSEAKLVPVRFNQKGDLYVDLPKNLEREYQDAHQLLTSYGEDNLSGIKHQLARLFYLNQILEQRIHKTKVNDKQYKKYVNLRARVLNDFKRYFNVVTSKEKNFDFEEYYKNTEFYPNTIKLDRHTMKYTGKLIKDFIKSQGI